MRTVVLAAALPMTSGVLSLDGEDGLVALAVGAAGAVESSMYVTDVAEHADALPAVSVAVA